MKRKVNGMILLQSLNILYDPVFFLCMLYKKKTGKLCSSPKLQKV